MVVDFLIAVDEKKKHVKYLTKQKMFSTFAPVIKKQ